MKYYRMIFIVDGRKESWSRKASSLPEAMAAALFMLDNEYYGRQANIFSVEEIL
jgi:hypothetical protein